MNQQQIMDFILHCNGLKIHIGINIAANIYQECVDDVVNGTQDLWHEISNNLAKYGTISTNNVGDPWKDKEKYLDYVRVNIAWSNDNGNNDTSQMIVSLISIARKETLELINGVRMRTVLNVDDLDLLMYYLMKLQIMQILLIRFGKHSEDELTNCTTLFQTKKAEAIHGKTFADSLRWVVFKHEIIALFV